MVISLAYQLMMASFFLVLALFLQDGLGLSALESGLIFLPLGLGYFAASVHRASWPPGSARRCSRSGR